MFGPDTAPNHLEFLSTAWPIPAFLALLRRHDLRTIHTMETTLEDVLVHSTECRLVCGGVSVGALSGRPPLKVRGSDTRSPEWLSTDSRSRRWYAGSAQWSRSDSMD
jgi:hypothetical protein